MLKKEAVEIYRKLSSIPSIKSAYIDSSTGLIHTTWSRCDLILSEVLKFCTIHLASNFSTTASFKVSNETWRVPSPSRKLTAVLSQLKDKDSNVKQYFEIWSANNLKIKIAVENLDVHGQIYDDDDTFGVMAWSHGEDKLLYVAEKKVPKSKSYFSEAKTDPSDTSVEGSAFEHREDWGELLVEKYQPLVCILDLGEKEAVVLDWLPENLSYGQAVWGADSETVYVVGWDNSPYKLGLIYCAMRKNKFFKVNLKDKTYTLVQDNGRCVSTAVLSRQGGKVAYLDNPQGGAHRHSCRLVIVDVATNHSKSLQLPTNNCCYIEGLHCDNLIHTAWCADERRIVLTTQGKSRREILVVDTHNETLTMISKEGPVGSWDILYVGEDGSMLASCSSPNMSPHLVIGKLAEVGEEEGVEWRRVTEPSPLCTSSSLTYSVHSITPPEKDFDYEYILLQPKSTPGKKHPLLVFNHGGPHSAYVESFSWKLACYCHLGYAILLTNYRGSYGYGEGNINSLTGKVGDQDVEDIKTAIAEVVAMGKVDEGKMGVVGGSHGGFLTAHFIGQYPDMFKVAVALNPVINMTNMMGVSDIPDWVYVELGFPFDLSLSVSEEMRSKMATKSPFAHVKKMKTPLLLAVGEKDRRVPKSQSIQLYQALKALNKPVKMYVFPKSSHPLREVETDSDLFVNMVLWIGEHINA